jgi:hypothetical protein
MATTGKIVEVLFENTLDTYNEQDTMLDLVDYFEPDASTMQNSDNVIWRPVEQHAPIIEGWDLTGQEQDIIEETYPAILGTPKNDFVKQRADDLRDMRFWQKRGQASGMQQASELNKSIINAVTTQGSMYYRSNATSGYDFIAEAQALMNERQGKETQRCFLLNDRSNLLFGQDLAARQTLQGRPEMTWERGQIGQNIAQFDVFTGSFLPNLVGGTSPDTTVTGDQSFAPEGGSVDSLTGQVTNVDYRTASITVASSAGYNVGDKIKFVNGGTDVNAIGLGDKTDTNQAMTFTVIAAPDATTLTIYPKPIAFDDGNLNATEQYYANVDTQIRNGAVVERLNVDVSVKTNAFWDKDAIEVYGGSIPANLFAEFDGNKVITETLKNGLEMYMVYDGNIEDMTFRYRLFTWYNVTVKDPSRVGIATLF